MQSFIEHLSGNKYIRYPFSEQAILNDTIVPAFIVDLLIFSPLPNLEFYLSSLIIRENDFDFSINNIFDFVNIDKELKENYVLSELTNGDYQCKIILVPFFINDVATGTYNFTADETKFEPSCIIPPGKRVMSIEACSIPLEENVHLGEGNNVSLSQVNDNIKIDFLPGAGDGAVPCEDNPLLDAIYSINTNNFGKNYAISGSECIEIINEPEKSLIIIHDRCKPCCADCEDSIDSTNNDTTVLQGDLDSLDARLIALGG